MLQQFYYFAVRREVPAPLFSLLGSPVLLRDVQLFLREMDGVRALHTAARRYCRARHDEWWEEYSSLGARLFREGKGSWKTNEFTEEEFAVYPRYLVLWAILKEVERLDPNSESTPHAMREALIQIGRDATDQFVNNPANQPGAVAMEDERMQFVEYITSLSPRKLAAVRPLPFRRVLRAEEERVLWSETKERWGITGHWYPLAGGDPPPDVMAFHTDYFEHQKIEVLRSILSEQGIRRMWELRWSIACEIEMDSFYPSFGRVAGSDRLYGAGEEGYWRDAENDWLVYVSHETSITLAGRWLIEKFEREVPDCRDSTFLGQTSTADLRGTW